MLSSIIVLIQLKMAWITQQLTITVSGKEEEQEG